MSTQHPHPHPPLHGELHNPDTAHEQSDISIRGIVAFVILLVGVALTVQAAMYGVFVLFDKVEAGNDTELSPLAAPANTPPPEPRLQTTPWTDLRALHANETSSLQGYGWIDQSGGVAHIPIDRAKALLLQKGIPVRPELADPAEGTSIAATGESNGGRSLPVSKTKSGGTQ
jgi:hypothetical protein